MKTAKVMIVDDDRLLGTLLREHLSGEPGLLVVGEATHAAQALPMARSTRPDVVLLDVELPGTDGIELIPQLRREVPGARIVILSSHFDAYTVYRILRENAEGYVEKPSSLDAVLDAVRCVAAGRTYFTAAFVEARRALLESPDAFQKFLSEREQEVMRWVASGASDAEIASRSGISAQTVATHRRNIRRKLDLHSDREMIAYSRRWGIRVLARDAKASSTPSRPNATRTPPSS